MKRKLGTVFIVILFIVGVGIMLYPTISSMINNEELSNRVTAYTENVKEIPKFEYKRILNDAKKYNKSLTTKAIITDPFDKEAYDSIGAKYEQAMNYRADGMICTIDIPKIHVSLPVYHGTEEKTLADGAGHLVNTSMPIGGKNTHAVIAAHSAFPGKTFFDYLEDMKIGDAFYIHVLDKTLKYEVDQIKVVLPEETNDLRIIPNEEHVTLLTCTPYSINTHRLLVRGKRVPYTPGEEVTEEHNFTDEYLYLFGYRIPYWVVFAVVGGFAALVVIVVIIVLKKKRNDDNVKQSPAHKKEDSRGDVTDEK